MCSELVQLSSESRELSCVDGIHILVVGAQFGRLHSFLLYDCMLGVPQQLCDGWGTSVGRGEGVW